MIDNATETNNKVNIISLQWLIGSLFIVFCTIPWVNFGLNKMDSQPWPILGSLFFLLVLSPSFKHKIFNFVLLWLISFSLIINFFYWMPQIDFILFRGVANYLGLFIVLMAFMAFLRKFGFPLTTLVIMNMVWLLAGFVEIISPGILNSFVLERTTSGRGITSLSPEPTFFGIYLFFNSWLILIGTLYRPSKKIKIMIWVNVLAILSLAMSPMVALFLIIAAIFVYLFKFMRTSIRKHDLIYYGGSLIVLVCVVVLVINLLEGSRLVRLIYISINMPLIEVFRLDASMNARLAHVVLPLHAFFYNYGIPGGFHSFGVVSQELANLYNGYFWYGLGGDKIMSWVGSFVYELGIIGFIVLSFLAIRLFDGTRKRMFEIILLFVLLLSAVPLAFPLIPFIIATLYYTRKNAHCPFASTNGKMSD